MKGEYQVRDAKLIVLHAKVKELVYHNDNNNNNDLQIEFHHIPREAKWPLRYTSKLCLLHLAQCQSHHVQ
jgi:hypothetical protein